MYLSLQRTTKQAFWGVKLDEGQNQSPVNKQVRQRRCNELTKREGDTWIDINKADGLFGFYPLIPSRWPSSGMITETDNTPHRNLALCCKALNDLTEEAMLKAWHGPW